MKLYIGGRYQGKTTYVQAQTGLLPVRCTPEEARIAPAVNCFHLLVRELLERGENLTAYLDQFLAENPQVIVVSDEIGLGVVPVNLFERRWREETGRALCRLAAQAETVERIACGLGQRLK